MFCLCLFAIVRSDVFTILQEIQRTWSYLEPLFIGSEEVKKELPEDAKRFETIDADVKDLLKNVRHSSGRKGYIDTTSSFGHVRGGALRRGHLAFSVALLPICGSWFVTARWVLTGSFLLSLVDDDLPPLCVHQMWEKKNVRDGCNTDGYLDKLESIQEQLELCKKSLADFLDGRRRQFPRYYFVSEADLLDILSNGSDPNKILVHTPKVKKKKHVVATQPWRLCRNFALSRRHFVVRFLFHAIDLPLVLYPAPQVYLCCKTLILGDELMPSGR